MANLRHQAVLAAKRLWYRDRGEPYRIAGHTLRYGPGTRPVRLRYASSTTDSVARYDALQVELIASALSQGDLAIDIGAHAGQYSLIMAALCGRLGRVIAFEPDPQAYALLERNIALNPGLKSPEVERMAVSDCNGEAGFFALNGNANSTLVTGAIDPPNTATANQLDVSVTRLDDYLADRGLPTPNWVKIDVEGAEIRVLKGAKKLLASRAGITCELHPYAWPAFENTFDELVQLAANANRRIRYLDEDRAFEGTPRYGVVVLEPLN